MIDMFNGCSSLKEIIVDGENAVYASEGGLLLNKAKDTVLVCPTGREDLEIPAGVTALEQTCLMSCTPALKILSLPKSVSSIRESLELIPDLILIVEKPADGEEMVHPFVSTPKCVSITPSMGVLFPILRRGKVSTLWS